MMMHAHDEDENQEGELSDASLDEVLEESDDDEDSEDDPMSSSGFGDSEGQWE